MPKSVVRWFGGVAIRENLDLSHRNMLRLVFLAFMFDASADATLLRSEICLCLLGGPRFLVVQVFHCELPRLSASAQSSAGCWGAALTLAACLLRTFIPLQAAVAFLMLFAWLCSPLGIMYAGKNPLIREASFSLPDMPRFSAAFRKSVIVDILLCRRNVPRYGSSVSKSHLAAISFSSTGLASASE